MTAQVGEDVKKRDEGVRMATERLQSCLGMGGHHPRFIASSTVLHRGRVGSWKITGGRLYLVNQTAVPDSGMDASLESVFPWFTDRVFAHWYSGTVRILRGEQLKILHG